MRLRFARERTRSLPRLLVVTCLVSFGLGCAGPKTYTRSENGASELWTLDRCSETSGGDAVNLVNGAQGWALSEASDAALQAPGAERIRVDLERRQVCLDAPKANTKYPNMCRYGLISEKEGDRNVTGYSACNSEFTYCGFDWADAILPPLLVFQGVVLTKACTPSLRADRLWSALEQAKVIPQMRSGDRGLVASAAGGAGPAPREILPAPAPQQPESYEAYLKRIVKLPTLWGIGLGQGTPASLEQMLGAPSACTSTGRPLPGAKKVCWKSLPNRDDVQEVEAQFQPHGRTGEPLLYSLGVRFEAASWEKLLRSLRAEFGPEDLQEPSTTDYVRWSWRWTDIDLARPKREGDGVGLYMSSTSFGLRIAEGRQVDQMVGAGIKAEPWGIVFGEDSVETVWSKLNAAGFYKPMMSPCRNSTPHAKTRQKWTCSMENRGMAGLNYASYDYLEFSDGVRLPFELSYNMRPDSRDSVLADLRQRYGPEVNMGGMAQWQVGPVEVTVLPVIGDDPAQRWYTISYVHSRLWQMGYGALLEDKHADEETRRRGL